MEQPVEQEHRRNANTHVTVNITCLVKSFLGKYYLQLLSHVFHILLTIVYFGTSNVIETVDEKFVHNSIIAILFIWGFSILMQLGICANIARFYMQEITHAKLKEISLEENKTLLWFSIIFVIPTNIPRAIVAYYFIPFTKSTICDAFGETHCVLTKIYIVYAMTGMCLCGMLLFCGFLICPNYLTGTPKNIMLFIRDNTLGLLFGNIMNTVSING